MFFAQQPCKTAGRRSGVRDTGGAGVQFDAQEDVRDRQGQRGRSDLADVQGRRRRHTVSALKRI